MAVRRTCDIVLCFSQLGIRLNRQFAAHTTVRKMVRVLNVAEKNDAAKNVSELLSRGQPFTQLVYFSRESKQYTCLGHFLVALIYGTGIENLAMGSSCSNQAL